MVTGAASQWNLIVSAGSRPGVPSLSMNGKDNIHDSHLA
jgi:hypothetical protein